MGSLRGPLRLIRKQLPAILVTCIVFFLITISVLNISLGDPIGVELLQKRQADLQDRLALMTSLYRSVQIELNMVQNRLVNTNELWLKSCGESTTQLPEYRIYGDERLLAGFNSCNESSVFDMPYVYQFLPHFLDNPLSTRPLYHLHYGNRTTPVEIIIGIPTVRRSKASYLTITLSHLITAMDTINDQTVIIVVMIGETDRSFILDTAKQIDRLFPTQLANGLIRIIAPNQEYYPNLNLMKPTLGDPPERFRWRTKQNLDAIFLMGYALDKATYYLMLEDDVVTKRGYLNDIKYFTRKQTLDNPDWVFIEYCRTGGIGKLFKTSELRKFLVYLQMFYTNMPIDWLTESYLGDKICPLDKSSKTCSEKKMLIRPKYSRSLFEHVGIYSSLKGKEHSPGKHSLPQFYGHVNPKLKLFKTDMMTYKEHSIDKIYDGVDFFWANQVSIDNYIEFIFETPLHLHRFFIRSGNSEHIHDIFYGAILKVLPENSNNYTTMAHSDSFGIIEGIIGEHIGKIQSLKIEILSVPTNNYWLIISEIEILPILKRR